MSTPQEQPPDELFWHDGSWYLFKPRNLAPPEPPKFEFEAAPEHTQMHRDLLWSMRIAPQPGPLCLITGV